MKPKYYVGPNHCRCHPETCCCNDWAVYDSEDDEVFETFFRKEDAEGRLIELDSLDLIPQATEGIKMLKEKLDNAEQQNIKVGKLQSRIQSMKAQDIRLLCGELSAQEMRTAKALLNWFSTELKYCRK